MLNRYRLNFTSALLYTSFLTVVQGGAVMAMEQDNIGFTEEKKNGLTVTSGKGTPQISAEKKKEEKFSKKELWEKSQSVMDFLESIEERLKKKDTKSIKGVRLKNALEFNDKIDIESRVKTLKFSQALEKKGLLPGNVKSLSELIYGLRKLDENYYDSMVKNFNQEKNNVTQNGYASDFIDPKNKEARKRFVDDACDIFSLRKETSETDRKKIEESQFTDFYSFVKFYLGLVRDVNGGLYTRHEGLNFTSLPYPNDNKNLTEEDKKTRRNVFSLHYLGNVEREFQILGLLKPLAEAAFTVNDKIFHREFIEDQLNYSQQALDYFFLTEHGISSGKSGEEFLNFNPEELPRKPKKEEKKKTQNTQKKKKQKPVNLIQKNIKEIKALQESSIKEAQTSVSKKEESFLISPPVVSSLKKELTTSGQTYTDWFYSTDGQKENLRRNYPFPTKEERQKEKRKLKEEKVNLSKINEGKEKEEENIPQENIKAVLHTPHKNGSKKLRNYHVKDIKQILNDAGYTPDALNKGKFEISGNPLKVFNAIHDLSFDGEMDQVTNMLCIPGIKGFVDETRSGSRIGIFLRHLDTNTILGTDLPSLANEK